MHRPCPPKQKRQQDKQNLSMSRMRLKSFKLLIHKRALGRAWHVLAVGTAQARTTTSSQGLFDGTYSWREKLSSHAHSKCQSICAEDIKRKVTMKYCGEWRRSSSYDCSALYHHQVFPICPPCKDVLPEMPYKIPAFTSPWVLLRDWQPGELCHRKSLSM